MSIDDKNQDPEGRNPEDHQFTKEDLEQFIKEAGDSVPEETLSKLKEELENNGRTRVYLASGWFSPDAAEELTKLEEIFDKRDWVNLSSPRRIFVCPPDAPKEVQDDTFSGNLDHIVKSHFLLVNTRDKDIGTIWEAGFAYAHQKPIVYFCAGLPEGAKFNLMLARSGVKVCTSFEQLEDYLDRSHEAEELVFEPYSQEIE